MAVKVVTPGDLGHEFDVGVIEANKVHLKLDNVTLVRHVGTGVLSAPAGAGPTAGDFKHGFQAADHAGWYILDGRTKASLSATAQAAATALGIGLNLPDGRDAVVKGKLAAEAMASLVGANSATIAQANLPNVNLTASTSATHNHGAATAAGGVHNHTTDAQGNHVHGITTMDNGGQTDNSIAQASSAVANAGVNTGAAGIHSHTTTASVSHPHGIAADGAHTHTVPLGGSGTALDVRQRSLNLNPFIYLGG